MPKRWMKASTGGGGGFLTDVIREQDVLITTAAVPGRKAPILVTREMAEAMQLDLLIVDMAAERR